MPFEMELEPNERVLTDERFLRPFRDGPQSGSLGSPAACQADLPG